MKKILRKICPNWIHHIYAETKFWIQFHLFPRMIVDDLFQGIMGYRINWKDPQDLNEKINWMKFYSDTSEWTRLADKYLARDYIKEKIGDYVLPKLYGVWTKAEEIDFNQLPDKFVMKTNHGCGDIVIVEDKSLANTEKIRTEMSNAIKHKFGYRTLEPHYMKISPVIMAEQLIENDSDFSTSIADYKVWCISGKPECILICSDRMGKKCTLSWYDVDWNFLPDVNFGRHAKDYKEVPRPVCLEQMLEYSTILSEGIPQVRVDFYIEKGKLYVGELTFTSQGGYMDYLSRDFSLKLGKNVPLIRKK